MSVEISVVIPTWNRRKCLEVVLPSLAGQSLARERYELLVCDSGSEDGTDELVGQMASQAAADGLSIRHLKGENRGRSGARNMGIREARGELVLFTDADIIADPHLLERHLESHRAHARESGGASCAVVGREIQVDTLEEYEAVRQQPATGRYLHPEHRKTIGWLYFLTGNASVPRADLAAVGCFDEDFTGYGHEDLELGYRLQKRGLVIRYDAAAINYHWHPVGFEEKCEKMKLAGISTMRFYNKHRDPRIKLLLGVNPLSMSVHALLARTGWFVPACQRRKDRSKFFSELLLQYHYLCGVKEALRAASTSP